MKIKPKIEILDLEKFLKEKSKQFDIPLEQLEEIASYVRRCYIHNKMKPAWAKVDRSKEAMLALSRAGVRARLDKIKNRAVDKSK